MIKWMLLISVLFFLKVAVAQPTDPNPGNLMIEIETTNFSADYAWLKKYKLDLTYVSKKSNTFHVLTTQDGMGLLLKKFKESQLKVSQDFLLQGPDEKYKSPEDVEAWISKMERLYPEYVHAESIGKSLEGREMWGIRLSDDASPNKDEPAVLFNALHHAREVMTVEVIMDIATWILENKSTNAQARKWLKDLQIYIIPMVNPDGSHKVWNENSMWRKNARGDYGVDINRNYPYKWNACDGSSDDMYAQDYRGPSAGSEPETQVMMAFIKKIRPSFDISFHSYGEFVIYPFGCNGIRTPTDSGVEKIGKEMAATIDYSPGTAWELLYDVDGGDIDWLFAEAGVIPFVIEVSPRRDGFQPSYDKRDPLVTKMRSAWQYLLKQFSGAGIKLQSRDAGRVSILKKVSRSWREVYSLEVTAQLKFYPLSVGNYKVKFRPSLAGSSAKDIVETFKINDNTSVSFNF